MVEKVALACHVSTSVMGVSGSRTAVDSRERTCGVRHVRKVSSQTGPTDGKTETQDGTLLTLI